MLTALGRLAGLDDLGAYSALPLAEAKSVVMSYLKAVVPAALQDFLGGAANGLDTAYARGIVLATGASGRGVYSQGDALNAITSSIEEGTLKKVKVNYANQALTNLYRDGYRLVDTAAARQAVAARPSAPAAAPEAPASTSPEIAFHRELLDRYARLSQSLDMSNKTVASYMNAVKRYLRNDLPAYDRGAKSYMDAAERAAGQSPGSFVAGPSAIKPSGSDMEFGGFKIKESAVDKAVAFLDKLTGKKKERSAVAKRSAWPAGKIAAVAIGAVAVLALAAWVGSRRD